MSALKMDPIFKIYPLSLRDGHREDILIEAYPGFLGVEEEALAFPEPVHIQGEAYLADDHMILHLQLKTKARLPCLMCNDPTLVELEILDFYCAEPLNEIPDNCFDYTEKLREAILLQTPAYVECHEGQCPERKEIDKYLKKEKKKPSKDREIPSYFPFADLDKK